MIPHQFLISRLGVGVVCAHLTCPLSLVCTPPSLDAVGIPISNLTVVYVDACITPRS